MNWKTLQPVKEKIETALHIPFFIDNDANVAALGERWKGAGENQPDVVFMTLGTGVGGGIVAEGRLLHGVRGLLVSLVTSLLTLMIQSNVPVVKKGCLETVASATGIVNLTRRYADENEGDSQLKVLIDNGEEVTAKTVFDLAKRRCSCFDRLQELLTLPWTCCCCNIGSTLNPSKIVIGGGVSAAGTSSWMVCARSLKKTHSHKCVNLLNWHLLWK